jgi:dihydroneopterin aldolase
MFIEDLEMPVQIGIHDFEKVAPQRIIFNIDLYVQLAKSTPQHDSIDEVVDYDFVRHIVKRRVEQGPIGLQETLGDDLLTALLSHPQVLAATVSTRKPDVYPDCKSVGVQTFRMKSE